LTIFGQRARALAHRRTNAFGLLLPLAFIVGSGQFASGNDFRAEVYAFASESEAGEPMDIDEKSSI